MFIWATRTLWALSLRVLFFIALFVGVVVLQMAVLSALRAAGWGPSPALAVSGATVLAAVLAVHFGFRFYGRMQMRALDRERERLGLPHGPCCVVWAAGPGDDIPWNVEGAFQLDYPDVAQRLKIEGVAVVEFQVDPEGRAKNIHCVDVWPAPIFYDAAVDALKAARFRPTEGQGPRFGPSYRVPFVFRIRGASRRRDAGQRVKATSHTVSSRIATMVSRKLTNHQPS